MKKIIINGNYYICNRMRVLSYLTEKGFTPSHSMPDVKNPSYTVWAFENTPELEAALNEYLNR